MVNHVCQAPCCRSACDLPGTPEPGDHGGGGECPSTAPVLDPTPGRLSTWWPVSIRMRRPNHRRPGLPPSFNDEVSPPDRRPSRPAPARPVLAPIPAAGRLSVAEIHSPSPFLAVGCRRAYTAGTPVTVNLHCGGLARLRSRLADGSAPAAPCGSNGISALCKRAKGAGAPARPGANPLPAFPPRSR